MKIVKSLLVIASFAFLISCGNKTGGNENNAPKPDGKNLNESDFNALLDKMKADGQINEDLFKQINAKLAEAKSEKNKSSENEAPLDTVGAIRVNSLTFFKDIYSDRSINLSKYLNKPIIITDLVLVDVFTEDDGEGFTKCASAFPFDPKSSIMAAGLPSATESPMYSFNNQPIQNIDIENFTNAFSNKPIKIKFKNADEFKKMNMLEWENNEGDNYSTKINVICRITKDDITYRKGPDDVNNIKAFDINVTFPNAEIIKK